MTKKSKEKTTAAGILASAAKATRGVFDKEIVHGRALKLEAGLGRQVRKMQGYVDPQAINEFLLDAMPPGLKIDGGLTSHESAMPPGLKIDGGLTSHESAMYCGLAMPMKQVVELEALWQRSQGNDYLLYRHDIPEPDKKITPEKAREKFFEGILFAMGEAHKNGYADNFTLAGRLPTEAEAEKILGMLVTDEDITPEAKEFAMDRLKIERMAEPKSSVHHHRRPGY